MTDLEELARLITGGLRNGVTVEDFQKATMGDDSIGLYISEAIIAAGWAK